MTAARRQVRWDRLDRTGTEIARLYPQKRTWHLQGKVNTELERVASKLAYHVGCDLGWRTRVATVRLRQGATRRKQGLTVDLCSQWRVWGEARPDLEGCVDVDLEISPTTNTIPIRRLGLKEGEAQEIRTVWVRVQDLTVERPASGTRGSRNAGTGSKTWTPGLRSKSTWTTSVSSCTTQAAGPAQRILKYVLKFGRPSHPGIVDA